MSEIEIERFIKLLRKWKKDDLNWGELCELKEFKYQFADEINEYWDNWKAE